ncbi:MAG: type II secretion system F family protein [Sulfurospirillum sp.]|nr:type II secretion system F family protein [Sulfurospirillum sp.]
MKYFQLEYLKNGQKLKKIQKSSHKIEAMQDFKASGMGVFITLEEVAEPLSVKLQRVKVKVSKFFSVKKVPLEPFIASLRQIAVMLNAGLPINTCLKDVITASGHKRIGEIFTTVLTQVESGVSISESFEQFEAEVGTITIAMIDLGEKTGTLDESINKLADILQEIYDNRMKLKKATRYPITVIFAMIIAFSLVITMVIPQFQSMFAEYQAKLPLPTLFLLWLEHALTAYGPFILIGAIGVGTALSIFYKRNARFRLLFDKYMLKTYIVGKVIYLSMIGRFIYVFDRLSTSGLPIIESLKTAIGIVDNIYLKEQLTSIAEAIEEGRSLTDGFKETKQFESMIIQMISAGEASGSINAMLDKITTIYRNKYNYLVDNVATMIEPLLITAIAGFVLLLALGIFLPMWSIAEAVGGI